MPPSGDHTRGEDEAISLRSRLVGPVEVPLDDVAEIRFARNSLAEETEPPGDSLLVQFGPLGQISGRPVSGSADVIRMVSPVCGEIETRLDSAYMLDFNGSNTFIDDWDAEF